MNNKGHGSFPLWVGFIIMMFMPIEFLRSDPYHWFNWMPLLADVVIVGILLYPIYKYISRKIKEAQE